ncbi:MAG: Rid family detoxifying hydrolase [Proteobacteria bacterium]|nr:Rid family detoxifying hydrolase [Pseudomonadota bacterium]MBU1741471.1 Rid family detoxifying hydrolase [Pseudomonadota bacterium]
MVKSLSSPNAPAAVGPYSLAVAAGDFVFVSGQIALKPVSGELVGPDGPAQMRQVLDNLRALLEDNGLSPSQVVKTTIFLTDINQFAAVNDVYAAFFGEVRPARSTIEVSALPKGALVELEAVLYTGS